MDMSKEFKIVIAGSRNFTNYDLLKKKMNSFLSEKKDFFDIVIISGTAKGADTLGEQYADEHGYKIVRFPADWNRFGNAAGRVRNEEMGEIADAVVAFWDGKSPGTHNMISIAKKKKLPLRVVSF